ncbi:MAG: DUF2497 domain-containing protein [Alphaproteobacteria bacterium]|nr:DUF2497 domain-containing protein [Alphaproteobacteria bacterium]
MEQQEPSMEEILSSIRRILSHEEETSVSNAEDENKDVSNDVETDTSSDVMELTEDMRVSPVQVENNQIQTNETDVPSLSDDMVLLSEAAVQASRDKLTHFVESVSKTYGVKQDNTNTVLEELVSSLLRPYLKEWLDMHLPSLVEQIVQKEIERLTNKVDLS